MPYFLLALNYLLMVLAPLILGWFIARRRQISWRYFGIGAATFILAQLIHIPFNYLVLNYWFPKQTPPSQAAMLILSATFLGLSAAVFEEGTRYLAYRLWAKDARTWGGGLMMGAGHGGAESILLGLLGALNLSILFGYQAGYFQGLIPQEQAPLALDVLNQMTSLPWFEMLLGALERVFVLCIQLALSLMVMQVFTRRRIKWLFLAIGWHAIIDAGAVLLIGSEGIYAAEIATGVAAIISLAVVLALREPEPGGVALEPLPAAAPAGPIRLEATQEKLEDSRYI